MSEQSKYDKSLFKFKLFHILLELFEKLSEPMRSFKMLLKHRDSICSLNSPEIPPNASAVV